MSKKVLFISDNFGLATNENKSIASYNAGILEIFKQFDFDVTLLVEHQRSYGMFGRFFVKDVNFKKIIESSNISEIYRYFTEVRYNFTWKLRKSRKFLGFLRKRKQIKINNPAFSQDLYPKRGRHLQMFDSFLWCDYIYSDAPGFSKRNKAPIEVDASEYDYVFCDSPHYIKINNICRSNVYQIIHDIDPLKDPKWSWDWRDMFLKKIKISLKNSGNLIFTSKTAQDDFHYAFSDLSNSWKEEVIYPFIRSDIKEIENREGTAPSEFYNGDENCFDLEDYKELPYVVMILDSSEERVLSLILRIAKNFKKRMNFVFLVGGDTEEFDRLKTSKNVYIKRFLSFDERNCIIEAAQLFIITNFSEGYGIPLLEASQFNLPILAPDLKIFREIGGGYIEYFNIHDPEAFSQAINDLVEDKGDRLESSQGLRQRIQDRFSMSSMTKKMYTFLAR